MIDLINTIQLSDFAELCARLPDASVDMILTDPPYLKTQNRWESAIDLEIMWREFQRVIKPRGAIVMTAMQPFTSRLVASNYEAFEYSWIWRKSRKTNFLNVKIMPMLEHEDILVFAYGGKPDYYPQMTAGDKHETGSDRSRLTDNYGVFNSLGVTTSNLYYPSTVLEFPHDPELSITYAHRPNKLERHPTQKPVSLFFYLIQTYTQEGAIVLDPFAGSGTTAVACLKTNRRYICGDFTPEYVELARKRVLTVDPFQDTPIDENHKQLSLFKDDKV